ncbi:DUF3592 domain-containing protein [Pseudomonas sp. 148P]|uniref:DUF3592 domain-containing protein n=1 Tax=Pseudomonas ulcerans TaxID=3115852 RepID=A0ABU7I026_9PSED|nr:MULTISPECIES: DUF3592 domain-containing protein [unclassified Pseudomonas]MEE1925812.1 DUF3592 domain-containing protein [Pseudomonas sp. 147P]MEE1937144.1 DUF3592 domain-containing protein [Pseudomonas sp. 148P]
MMLFVVIFMAQAIGDYLESREFVANAMATTGVVVEVKERNGESAKYFYPVVAFRNENGQRVTFSPGLTRGSPDYEKGERVPVLYLPGRSEEAQVDSFFNLWLGSLIQVVMVLPFLLLSYYMMKTSWRRVRKSQYLQKYGMEVRAEFMVVRRNHRILENGSSPFFIVCRWVDPQNSQVHVFRSENIGFDPSRYIFERTIRVFMDKRDAQNYYVDISFLPKVSV